MSDYFYYEQIGVAMTCRNFEEYMKMFSIELDDLAKGTVLDVAAGASSFVAEATTKGLHAIAVDPLYELEPKYIMEKGTREIEESTSKLLKLQAQFDWTYYGNLDNHRALREASLLQFIQDYRLAKNARYIAAQLPSLPFEDGKFEIVLCSHFLFLYGEQFDLDFHRRSIDELLRVCRKGGRVLIYPLKTLGFSYYDELSKLIEAFPEDGISVNYLPTKLPFIPGSSKLLCLVKR